MPALFDLLLWQPLALADGALCKLLAKGGQGLMIHHGLTTPGVGDPPGFRLEDCTTQRNLSEEGRAAPLTGVSPATGEILALIPGCKDGFRVAGRMIAWN